MGKLVMITVFLTALSATISSAPSEIYYEKVISDGENIVHVTPILDNQNELSGIIYTDSSLNQISIEYLESDSFVSFEVPASPLKTILRYSELRDTMFLYTLSLTTGERPQITYTIYTNEIITQETFITPTNAYSGQEPYLSTTNIEHYDLRFYPDNKKAEQIIFEFNFRVDNYIFSVGQESINVPTTLIYSLDFEEIVEKFFHTNIYPSNLFSTDEINYINGSKYYHYSDIDNSYEMGETSYQSMVIADRFGNPNSSIYSDYNNIFSVHVDNFAPSSPTDELIIHSNSIDLLNYYESAAHIACYSFADGSPKEIWYNNEITDFNFSYVYKSKDLLVGTHGSDNVITLNYLNGQVTDSTELDDSLNLIEFFETGSSQPVLNLIGMSGNTVKNYRFNISTDITELSIEHKVPQTFNLLQNHPNPFNGETRLEFSNSESQHLKLSIFNILGQEINILAVGNFPEGSYSYYWDGNDANGLSQSTGVYFARLESKTTSQMIKLIYLK